MDDAGVAAFVGHYEPLTRDILSEMPGRVDLIFPRFGGHTELAGHALFGLLEC